MSSTDSSPLIRFQGITLSLSGFKGCSVDVVDGKMVLSFSNFSGCVTLANEQQQENVLSDEAMEEQAMPSSQLQQGSVFEEKATCEAAYSPAQTTTAVLVSPPPTASLQRQAVMKSVLSAVDGSDNVGASSSSGNKRGRGTKAGAKKRTRISEPAAAAAPAVPACTTPCPDRLQALGSNASPTDDALLFSFPSPALSCTSRSSSTSAATAAAIISSRVTSESRGPRPLGRWGHTSTLIAPGRLVVYGGQADDEAQQATLGDLHVCDLTAVAKNSAGNSSGSSSSSVGSSEWIRPINCDSVARAWHTACFLPTKNLLVTFGGERAVNGDPECLEDIMVLDTEIYLFYPPAMSGKSPPARSGHSAAVLGKDLVVFGGCRGRKWQSSTYVLDTDKWHWRCPSVEGNPPTARSYHSATALEPEAGKAGAGHRMVIIGGNSEGEVYGDVVVLEARATGRWRWSRPLVVGDAPAPRTGHSAVLLQDGVSILISGGWDPDHSGGERYFEDSFVLNTELWEWRAARTACPAFVGQSCLLVTLPAAAQHSSNNNTNNTSSSCIHSTSYSQEEAQLEQDVGTQIDATAADDDEEAVTTVAAASESKEVHMLAFFGGQDKHGVRTNELCMVPATAV